MFKKLENLTKEFKNISNKLLLKDLDFSSKEYFEISKRYRFLEKSINFYDQYKVVNQELLEIDELLNFNQDKDLLKLLIEEKKILSEKHKVLVKKLKELMYESNNVDSNKNIIMEIRAGAGGNEASLFVGNLYRMYVRFSEKQNWNVELLSSNESEPGGFKEIIYSISGEKVYDNLKFEMGVHRVQRIPVTESGGRIHTSTVTVAVLPEVKEEDIVINLTELRIDTYRSQGAGGQHVNTTDSAIRIIHLPSGIVVQCQDEKSQHKNKVKAMRVLRAKLQKKLEENKQEELSQERKDQIGTGSRSEKIRTYNYPQNRFTDHRINFHVYNKLSSILDGELDNIIKVLKNSLINELK